MITVTTAIINNEWYFTHDGTNVIKTPEYVDMNTSAIISEGVSIECFQTEKECHDQIAALKLVMPKDENLTLK